MAGGIFNWDLGSRLRHEERILQQRRMNPGNLTWSKRDGTGKGWGDRKPFRHTTQDRIGEKIEEIQPDDYHYRTGRDFFSGDYHLEVLIALHFSRFSRYKQFSLVFFIVSLTLRSGANVPVKTYDSSFH